MTRLKYRFQVMFQNFTLHSCKVQAQTKDDPKDRYAEGSDHKVQTRRYDFLLCQVAAAVQILVNQSGLLPRLITM